MQAHFSAVPAGARRPSWMQTGTAPAIVTVPRITQAHMTKSHGFITSKGTTL